MTEKATMEALARLVPEGSRVLDLGCGDGSMLDYLQRSRGCSGYGIEIADANVLACVRRGVNVIQLNLDEGLAMFGDSSFDVVLQIDTLQHLRNAEVMLRETARVGRTASSRSPTSRTGPTACRCCAGACRSRAACPTSGMTRPTSVWAPTRTLRCSRSKTSCG